MLYIYAKVIMQTPNPTEYRHFGGCAFVYMVNIHFEVQIFQVHTIILTIDINTEIIKMRKLSYVLLDHVIDIYVLYIFALDNLLTATVYIIYIYSITT